MQRTEYSMWMSVKFSRRYNDIPGSARSNYTSEGATWHWLTLHTFYEWGKQSDIGRLPSSRGQVEPDLVQLLPQRAPAVFRLGPVRQDSESGAGRHNWCKMADLLFFIWYQIFCSFENSVFSVLALNCDQLNRCASCLFLRLQCQTLDNVSGPNFKK